MGHAGAAAGFHECFFNDAVFDIQRQFAGALLGSAPAHAVGQAGNIRDFPGLRPVAFLRDRSRTMVAAFLDATHLFDFVCKLHGIRMLI